MTEYTRAQILENRRKWIDYLKLPDTKKSAGRLENPVVPENRCCLGHACHVLIPELRKQSDESFTVYYDDEMAYAPVSLKQKLGLYDRQGGNLLYDLFSIEPYAEQRSLSEFNDYTAITPQEIGAYLETVIEGGPKTPFRPLSEYSE